MTERQSRSTLDYESSLYKIHSISKPANQQNYETIVRGIKPVRSTSAMQQRKKAIYYTPRKTNDDKINYHVGYDDVLGVGNYIDASTPVIKVLANSKYDFDRIKDSIINCFVVSNQKIKKPQIIYEVIK